MIERRGYKFRLYMDPDQDILGRKTAGCCRLVFNLCLDQKILERHRSEPRRLSAFDQQKELKDLKTELPFLKEVPHHPLQQAIVDLHRAYENFFEGRAAFPTFRKKSGRTSFRYPDPTQFRFDVDPTTPVAKGKGSTAANRCRIFLPKLGWVDLVRHRAIRGTMKSATVSRTADAWYVSILTEREVAEALPNGKPATGVDGGITQPLVFSDGGIVMLPRVSPAERKRKAALQKQLARQKKGSKNHLKTLKALARIDARWARRRKDAAEKESTHRTQNHGLIAIEDLPLKNMVKSAKGTVEKPGKNVRQKAGLNRSFHDVALGQVYEMYARKAPRNGCLLLAVEPAYTSQGCRVCGHVAKENRPTRDRFECVACGHVADADHNAAGNVLDRGLALYETTYGKPYRAAA